MPKTRHPSGRSAAHLIPFRLADRLADPLGGPMGPDEEDLRPIGRKGLRALGIAIRDGTYPEEEKAREGLLRIFLEPLPRRRGSDAGR